MAKSETASLPPQCGARTKRRRPPRQSTSPLKVIAVHCACKAYKLTPMVAQDALLGYEVRDADSAAFIITWTASRSKCFRKRTQN
jgi:hypothetical protein